MAVINFGSDEDFGLENFGFSDDDVDELDDEPYEDVPEEEEEPEENLSDESPDGPSEDAEDADAVSEAEVTTDLSAAKAGPKHKRERKLPKAVAMSVASMLGIAAALLVALYVIRPLIQVPSGSVSETQSEETVVEEGGEDTQGEAPEASPEKSEAEPEASTSALDDIVDTGQGYGVSKLVADPSSESVALHGRIRNMGEDVHENVAMGVYLYDRDGTVIGVATGFVDRIEPGATADFVATSDIATADVSRVALVEVRW